MRLLVPQDVKREGKARNDKAGGRKTKTEIILEVKLLLEVERTCAGLQGTKAQDR